MTTLVYMDGRLAADTQAMRANGVVNTAPTRKVWRWQAGDVTVIAGGVGVLPTVQQYIRWLQSKPDIADAVLWAELSHAPSLKPDPDDDSSDMFIGLQWPDGKRQLWTHQHLYGPMQLPSATPVYAMGSGAEAAMGAYYLAERLNLSNVDAEDLVYIAGHVGAFQGKHAMSVHFDEGEDDG